MFSQRVGIRASLPTRVFVSCLQSVKLAFVRGFFAASRDLFHQVTEDRVQQMERENSFILRWNDKKDTTVSPSWQNPNRKHKLVLSLSHFHLRALQRHAMEGVFFGFFFRNGVGEEGRLWEEVAKKLKK